MKKWPCLIILFIATLAHAEDQESYVRKALSCSNGKSLSAAQKEKADLRQFKLSEDLTRLTEISTDSKEPSARYNLKFVGKEKGRRVYMASPDAVPNSTEEAKFFFVSISEDASELTASALDDKNQEPICEGAMIVATMVKVDGRSQIQ